MMENLKKVIYMKMDGTIDEDLENLVDFSPDSDINTAIRKTHESDILNFAMFYEGNVYNKLINKVTIFIWF